MEEESLSESPLSGATVVPLTPTRTPSDTDDPEQDQDQEDQEEASASGDSASLPINQTHRRSSRQMRNQAEKARRDKLNTHINELANLVPMVATSSKRMDKTSILRLSATFLRMRQLIVEHSSLIKSAIPQFFESVNWPEFLLEDMSDMVFIVTSAGKVVFVSQLVEKTLGHPQLELMGQSLFEITYQEDHDTLEKNLLPDHVQDGGFFHNHEVLNEDSSSSGDTLTFSGSSCSDQSCGRPVSGAQREYEKQKRSFFIRLRVRSTSKSVETQYEYVHFSGHLRVPILPRSAATASRLVKHGESVINKNDIALFAVAKLFKEMKPSDLTLLEANKDAYLTRHEMDGSFIYSDHKISLVAGYLAREVRGQSAFNYMHRDDVLWVLIALRQMFIEADGPGRSCYRLRTKTGQFIYLRTMGFLEPNNKSFLCINTHISEEEYREESAALRQRFTPVIEKSEPGLSAITSVLAETADGQSPDPMLDTGAETKKSAQLEMAVKTIISDIVQVSPKFKEIYQSPASDISSLDSHSQSQLHPPQKHMVPSPISPKTPEKPALQDRPSVLRVNHSSTDTVSVVLPASLSPQRRKSVVSHSSQLVEVPEAQLAPERTVLRETVVKRKGVENEISRGKRLRCEVLSPEVVATTSPHTLVNSYSSSALDTSSSSSSSLSSSSLSSSMSTSVYSLNDSGLTHYELDKADMLSLGINDFQPNGLESIETGVDDVDGTIVIESVLHPPDPWKSERDVLETNLRRNHLLLDPSIGLGEEHNSTASLTQLTPLTSLTPLVPHHMSSMLQSNFSQLKAQPKKQQILGTLKQEPLSHNQNFHHHVDELSNIQQDVGV